jgi:hypothetical protein
MNENLAGLKKGGKWQIQELFESQTHPEETKITSNPILAIQREEKTAGDLSARLAWLPSSFDPYFAA